MPLLTAAADDTGVLVRYKSFGEDEYIVLRSVLTDEILDNAREAGNASGKFRLLGYLTRLFTDMILDYHITDGDGEPWMLTEANLKGVPTHFRQWLQAEIDRCDGSVAGNATVTIKGVDIPFREAT